MKRFLNSYWLRAVQFFRNTVPKNEIQCKKNTVQKKYSANFLILNFSNFLIAKCDLSSGVTHIG